MLSHTLKLHPVMARVSGLEPLFDCRYFPRHTQLCKAQTVARFIFVIESGRANKGALEGGEMRVLTVT